MSRIMRKRTTRTASRREADMILISLHGRRAVRAKTNRAHNQTTASPPPLGSVVQVGELSPGARRRHHDKTVLTLYRYKHIFPRWTC